jgi:carbamoyl-phosphate synthase large subunit
MAAMARELKVVGLMNAQFAIQGEEHLRAGGQPARLAHGAFVSKAIGRPLAKIAARCMVGQSLAAQKATKKSFRSTTR